MLPGSLKLRRPGSCRHATAEWVSRTLCLTIPKPARLIWPATRLSEGRRRQAKAGPASMPTLAPPRPQGVPGLRDAYRARSELLFILRRHCQHRGARRAASHGRIAAQSREAQTHRAETQRRHAAAKQVWQASDQPALLDEETYLREIQPRLSGITVSALSSALGVSMPYTAHIRAARRIPHSRHWQTLARLVGVLAR